MSATTIRYISLLIWAAYLTFPTDAGGLLHGNPIGPLEACGLLVLAWLAVWGGPLPGAWLAAIVLVVSTVVAAAIPGTSGFRARYFANAEGIGAHERSTEYRDSVFTRIDRRLDFAPGGPEFPLAFFNDNSRFNFYRADQPHRRRLPFAVSWSGLWWTEAGAQHLYLHAPQAAGEVFVDGVSLLTAAPGDGFVTGGLTLTAGWHRLDVRFSSPYAAPRQFAAGSIVDGQYRPFDATAVATQQVRGWQMQSARMLRLAKTAADAMVLAWLGWLFVASVRARVIDLWQRESVVTVRRRAVPLLAIAAAVEALVFAWPWSRQVMLLMGGDDPMTYEGYARDILFNGILMNGGLPTGQGEPFYYQAFYPYFLALLHALTGEGTFGIVLVQRLLAAWTIWKLVEMAVMLSKEAAWLPALVIATGFVGWKFWPIAAGLANESLYVPLLVAWTASTMAVCREPSVTRAWTTGLLGGVAAITRSTVLLGWAVAWPLCWWSWAGRRQRVALATRLAVASLAVFSLIGIRNWIVAHEIALTSTGLGVTLLGGYEIPPEVIIDLTARQSAYDRLGLNEATAQVIEFAVTAPAAFLRNLGVKALFALGFYEWYAPGWGWSPVYVAVWTTALFGLVIAARSHPGARASSVVPWVVALSQLVAVVIIYPKNERLIVPIHVLLVPYSAIAAWWLIDRVNVRRGGSPVNQNSPL